MTNLIERILGRKETEGARKERLLREEVSRIARETVPVLEQYTNLQYNERDPRFSSDERGRMREELYALCKRMLNDPTYKPVTDTKGFNWDMYIFADDHHDRILAARFYLKYCAFVKDPEANYTLLDTLEKFRKEVNESGDKELIDGYNQEYTNRIKCGGERKWTM